MKWHETHIFKIKKVYIFTSIDFIVYDSSPLFLGNEVLGVIINMNCRCVSTFY